MRRIAAHYVYYRQLHPLSYIELDDEGSFNGISSLDGEVSGTEFYDGLLVPLKDPERVNELATGQDVIQQLRHVALTDDVSLGDKVYIYRFPLSLQDDKPFYEALNHIV